MNRQSSKRLGALAALLALAQAAMAAADPGLSPASGATTPWLIAAAQRHEHGEGVERDMAQARVLYCQAALLGDAQAQYALGWMLANGRGGGRDDGAAASLFALAAAQGHPQAGAMLRYTGGGGALPECMRPPPPPPPPPEPEAEPVYPRWAGKVKQIVEQLAPQFEVDPRLVMAIIAVESGFNANAVSPRNAQGLMQLIPATAERFRVKDAFDAEQNIRGGLAYLRWLLAYFKGNVLLVTAAYNAGERAVENHGGVPPYPETQDYVRKIGRLYKQVSHPYQSGLLKASSPISAAK